MKHEVDSEICWLSISGVPKKYIFIPLNMHYAIWWGGGDVFVASSGVQYVRGLSIFAMGRRVAPFYRGTYVGRGASVRMPYEAKRIS